MAGGVVGVGGVVVIEYSTSPSAIVGTDGSEELLNIGGAGLRGADVGERVIGGIAAGAMLPAMFADFERAWRDRKARFRDGGE